MVTLDRFCPHVVTLDRFCPHVVTLDRFCPHVVTLDRSMYVHITHVYTIATTLCVWLLIGFSTSSPRGHCTQVCDLVGVV